jgi:hypothetical protein
MGLKTTARSLQSTLYAPSPGPPANMIAARVTKYDDRRGEGEAVLKASGRKVRIPLAALREAKVVALSVGDEIYLALDGFDKRRADAIFVPD